MTFGAKLVQALAGLPKAALRRAEAGEPILDTIEFSLEPEPKQTDDPNEATA
jgi:hypothetical protein